MLRESREIFRVLSATLETSNAMSEGCSIESPYNLATLPQPFNAAEGKTFAVPVFGYKAQKSRKRPEVAVCIDGEGIQLYNVRARA